MSKYRETRLLSGAVFSEIILSGLNGTRIKGKIIEIFNKKNITNASTITKKSGFSLSHKKARVYLKTHEEIHKEIKELVSKTLKTFESNLLKKEKEKKRKIEKGKKKNIEVETLKLDREIENLKKE